MSIITSLSTLLHWTVRKNFATSGALPGQDVYKRQDQYFAELVLERKQTNPALELIAVIPYRKRLDSLNKKTRTRELLEACLLYTSRCV